MATLDEHNSIKLTKFGWCITNHHTVCILEFPGHRCSCECHAVFKEDKE